ncbi:PGAP1-domain-containing protein [Dothidotthia symphoricarpi CBS 119687]|uniref:GPI inositol-deacylase n=1 Tax=Dothidotthia symphoricarpi CBS 119687 TaxID=1392245 RepID=A0A6A6A8V0_9PLEO|nr:PGAP1-domain-containing protein [Dothidotthia symphoricarpi CBS 119687]KAF2127603.1 PGAP1-domain-containing protein [Dothidotthia symphoricarpi CBS 119687]
MQRRSLVEHETRASTFALDPAKPLEHGDKLDSRPDALDTEAPAWTDSQSRKEAASAPVPRPSSANRHTSSTSLDMLSEKTGPAPGALPGDTLPDSTADGQEIRWRRRLRNPWAYSPYTLLTTLLAFAALFLMVQSFLTRQLDVKGCEMSYMRPSFSKYNDFDTEHTRFASKYSLYLYREGGIDDDIRVKGVPVLFIPGNAGSYKQVRPLAAEAAYHYHNALRHDIGATNAGKRPLDFFSVDFNEDITAFHGQTLLDQAEYLNDAITFILSLYHTPGRSLRDSNLPDPTSVIIVGHSMGGMVARTMLTMPNYQANSINTVITLAAPHARPPVSFDGDIVRTYKGVNDYWRHAYSQKWAVDNPLWHVTLISIAGGGLDTIVSSDYASLASLVPETHGFTVFTSSMPNVWTGMDHLAITWCDQERKSIVRALYDVIDVSRATQTVPRAQRMRGFKKWFLTGLEDIAEKTLPHVEVKTLLTLEERDAVVSQGEKLVLSSLGKSKQKPSAHLLPVPPQDAREGKKFTLLTNEKLDLLGEHGKLEVLFCSVSPSHAGQSAIHFSVNMDLSGDGSSATRLACKNAASDVILLPASTRASTFPFKTDQRPFSYLQYDIADLAEHQFVAVVDKAGERSTGWVVAEFSNASDSAFKINVGLQRLLTTGLSFRLPVRRPLAMDVNVPALHSSLLAYNIHIGKQSCDRGELFAPLLRQYITDVYESKFFVNVKDASINLHGVAPYMPPALHTKQPSNGLSLQIWTDPTCDSSVEVSLRVDILGSLGKLWMRYRIVFAAFPILVVTLVLRQQFRTYDETAVFMSFAEGLNECIRGSLPLAFVALTFLSVTLAGARHQSIQHWSQSGTSGNTTQLFEDARGELLMGSDDTFFWFLVPLFGLMCVGICVAINYVALLLTYLLATIYSVLSSSTLRNDEGKRTPSDFAVTSTRQRIITTLVLLSLISTVIPYHFAYMVLCLVQLATCVRAFHLARASQLDSNYNFYNYAHSILILMLWILPINLPVLVVWVRNLAVHWLTPFSSHHNILSIMPFILLVETLSTGRMVPRVQSRFSVCTGVFLFSIAAYAAVYGVTYAYVLHHLANILCAWLVAVHVDASGFSAGGIGGWLEGVGKAKKRP